MTKIGLLVCLFSLCHALVQCSFIPWGSPAANVPRPEVPSTVNSNQAIDKRFYLDNVNGSSFAEILEGFLRRSVKASTARVRATPTTRRPPATTTRRSNTVSPTAGPARPSPAGPNNAACGKPRSPPSATANVAAKIVNGVVVPTGGQPWACAIVQGTRFQFCDCTVISDQWVVTAGHCVADSTEAQMKQSDKIFMGVTNLVSAVAQNMHSISRVILHPQYDSSGPNNDIALIKLATRITAFSDSLMPACLPTQPIDAVKVQTGTKGRRICYVTGWGTLSEGQSGPGGQIGSGSDKLLQAAIEMFSAADCQKTIGSIGFKPATMVCGGYDDGKFDSCQGDSGGPLVCDAGDGTWTLNGVVSFGAGCARAGQPGVYTNVYAFVSWIRQTMAAN